MDTFMFGFLLAAGIAAFLIIAAVGIFIAYVILALIMELVRIIAWKVSRK